MYYDVNIGYCHQTLSSSSFLMKQKGKKCTSTQRTIEDSIQPEKKKDKQPNKISTIISKPKNTSRISCQTMLQ